MVVYYTIKVSRKEIKVLKIRFREKNTIIYETA